MIEVKVYLTSDLLRALDQLSTRTRRPKSEIIRVALASFLSPESSEQTEAAVTRRLDRISRHLQRLERDLAIGNEAIGLFVRAWLTATPAVPEPSRAAAHAAGRERYLRFVQRLGQRLADGRSLAKEALEDVPDEPTVAELRSGKNPE